MITLSLGITLDCQTPPLTPPSAPTSLVAIGGSTQVSLAWTAPVGSVTGYKVYRGTTPGGEGGSPIATPGTNAYTDTGLSAGTTYYYTVKATNTAGDSAASSEASTITIPATPTNPAATAGDTQVVLNWDAMTGASGYKVYRGTTPGGESGTAVASPGTNTYTDTGLTNGTTYYYKVSAINASGESAKSSEVSAAPATAGPVAGYVAWWDAGLSTLYQNSNGTTAATSDGNPVGYASDQSANGHNLLQATAGNRPVLKLNIVNGLPVLRFAGGNSKCLNATFTLNLNYHVFMVLSQRTWTNGNYLTAGTANGTGGSFQQEGTSPQFGYSAGNFALNSGLTLNAFHQMDYSLSSTAIVTTVDQGTPVSSAVSGDNSTGFAVGDYTGDFFNQGGDIDVAALIIYPSVQTGSNLTAIRNYLKTRYGTP